MDKKTLLAFVNRILSGSNNTNVGIHRVSQLRDILIEQQADAELIELLEKILERNEYFELKQIMKTKSAVDEADFEIAAQRVEQRRIEEEQNRLYGRC